MLDHHRPLTADLAEVVAAVAIGVIDALRVTGDWRVEVVQALANDLHAQAAERPASLLAHVAFAVMARE